MDFCPRLMTACFQTPLVLLGPLFLLAATTGFAGHSEHSARAQAGFGACELIASASRQGLQRLSSSP